MAKAQWGKNGEGRGQSRNKFSVSGRENPGVRQTWLRVPAPLHTSFAPWGKSLNPLHSVSSNEPRARQFQFWKSKLSTGWDASHFLSYPAQNPPVTSLVTQWKGSCQDRQNLALPGLISCWLSCLMLLRHPGLLAAPSISRHISTLRSLRCSSHCPDSSSPARVHSSRLPLSLFSSLLQCHLLSQVFPDHPSHIAPLPPLLGFPHITHHLMW